MKIFSIIKKNAVTQLRDYWVLLLTLMASPFFVLIYWLISGGFNTTYNIGIINYDGYQAEKKTRSIELIVENLKALKYKDGTPMVKVELLKSDDDAKRLLKERGIDVFLTFPKGFSSVIKKIIENGDTSRPAFQIAGDPVNPKYLVAAIVITSSIEDDIKKATGLKSVVTMEETFIGNSLEKNDFDLYVPGLLIFSVIMVLLTAAMIIIKDVEDKTILRLKITNMKAWEYLGGISLVQVVLAALSVLMTFGIALALGFHYSGSLWLAAFISVLTSISIIGISLILVSFCKTSSAVLTVGNFPLFILMFFSGAMMPMPNPGLFTIAGKSIGWNVILPPSHAVIALNKILSLGEGFSGVVFEISALVVTGLAYFAIGVWLFKKKHLTAE